VTARARRLSTDPCEEYFDSPTNLLCKSCDRSDPNIQYELFIMSPTIVHCAKVYLIEKICMIHDLAPY